MAQVYVIYLRSDLMVHDIVLTRATATIDFQQFLNPVPDSYVDRRKRANPVLYANMSDVDFLVLQPPQSWSQTDHANPVASWRSRPNDVVSQIRSATASQTAGGNTAVSTSAPISTTAAPSGKNYSIQYMTPWQTPPLQTKYDVRYDELMCTDGRELQAVYPPEVVLLFSGCDGSPGFELYLTEKELLELQKILRYVTTRDGDGPESGRIRRVNRLLAFREKLGLKKGKS